MNPALNCKLAEPQLQSTGALDDVVAVIEYKVWIVPGKQLVHSSQTSANVYMHLNGELGRTERILLPKGCIEFSFKVNICLWIL